MPNCIFAKIVKRYIVRIDSFIAIFTMFRASPSCQILRHRQRPRHTEFHCHLSITHANKHMLFHYDVSDRRQCLLIICMKAANLNSALVQMIEIENRFVSYCETVRRGRSNVGLTTQPNRKIRKPSNICSSKSDTHGIKLKITRKVQACGPALRIGYYYYYRAMSPRICTFGSCGAKDTIGLDFRLFDPS